MGLFSRITGRGGEDKKKAEEAKVAAEEASRPAAPSEILHDTSPSSGGGAQLGMGSSSGYGPPTIPTGASAGGAGLPNLGPRFGAVTAVPSQRLYDPYDGISQAVGGTKHAFKLPDRPEFVFDEEASVRRRGWTESLQFYTGLGYTLGGAAGISAGVFKFATSKPEFQGPETLKLKANRLLNSSGSFGRPLGNSCGIMGLMFASFESFISYQLEYSGLPAAANSMIAGAATGALFRSPRGPRQAVAAAAVGVAGGTGVAALRTVFPSL